MLNLDCQLENFRRQLRALKYNHDINFQGIIEGCPTAFVDFYRHLLCEYNADLTKRLVDRGFSILGTTDYRFMEVLYRILRDMLNLRPSLTLTQFYNSGFVERKLEMAALIASRIEDLMYTLSKAHKPTTLHRQMRRDFSYGLSRLTRDSSFTKRNTVSALPNTSKSRSFKTLSRSTGKRQLVESKARLSNRKLTSNLSSAASEIYSSEAHHDWSEISPTMPSTSKESNLFHMWPEKSNSNTSRQQPRNCRYGDPASSEQQNQCSTFSASIPNVAQLDQFCQRTQNSRKKQGKICHPQCTYSRPCSLSGIGNASKGFKLPPTSQRSPSLVHTLSTNMAASTCSASRLTSPARRGSYPPGTSDGPSRDVMQDILVSISLLSGKVDAMLMRMEQLESRLPAEDPAVPLDSSIQTHGFPKTAENGALFYRWRHEEIPSISDSAVENSFRSVVGDRPFPRSSTEIQLPSPHPRFQFAGGGTTSSRSTTEVPSSVTRKPYVTNQYRPSGSAGQLCSTLPPSTATTSVLSNLHLKDSPEFNKFEKQPSRIDDEARTCSRNPRCAPALPIYASCNDDPAISSTTAMQTNTICPSRSDSTRLEVGDESVASFSKLHPPDKASWPSTSLGSSTSTSQPISSLNPTYDPSISDRIHLGDSFDCLASNNNSKPSEGTESTESYRSQVDRITMMLAETQGLLNIKHRDLIMNGAA